MDRDFGVNAQGDPDPTGVPDGQHWTRYYLHPEGLGSIAAVTSTTRTGGLIDVKER